ncbi:hypothetical protein CANCADRAFT_30334 [Tortispora caseinolytica NRRL Y-17796]|uniref:Class II aldolase/adducin N-terminal domain-containing protein n=1 Tax=Tortispora caseinolytica NRRL Y-17796 TaxID=767744 RepID=A0A1E4TJX1_9ASCO|nr:hypothetical protein CANCADRAFT_30334 [Tortispora caseinolytica NRRL Y-17796]
MEELCSDPKALIVDFFKEFHRRGYAVGSGGAMGVINEDSITITPTGLPKDMLKPSHLVDCDHAMNPLDAQLCRPSACLPIFAYIWKQYPSLKAFIHTHSINSVLAANKLATSDEHRQSHFGVKDYEQIKAFGIPNTSYLVVPIIDNKPTEQDLVDPILQAAALPDHHPSENVKMVLVKNHGIFVFARNIIEAKIYMESLEYLFELQLKS